MRTKENFLFVYFTMFLLLTWVQVDHFFTDYFSEGRELHQQKRNLQNLVEREKLHSILLQNQLFDLSQEVAHVLPAQKMISKDLRDLGQTVRRPAADGGWDLSSELMNHGRQQFKQKNYSQAAISFRELTEKYPTSALALQAQFLLGESLFQLQKYEDCLDVVDLMISQFPESELTGYLLLRQGQILMLRQRSADALDVFQLVAQQFADSRDLKTQAEKLQKQSQIE